jgi:RIO-like serine/threonine protein kinase
MLLMAWGSESTGKLKQRPVLRREILRSKNEICALGVGHGDLQPDNILWNAELERTLIIDFHHSTLDCQPIEKHMASLKRSLCSIEARDPKQLRVK